VHNLTQGTYYTTIQAAFDDADNGDTIEVSDGTYDESIAFPYITEVILQSVNGPSSTIIRGDDGSTTVSSNNPEGTTLEGFTITHREDEIGAGIYIGGGHLNVFNCIITNNTHTSNGAVVNKGIVTVENSEISYSKCTQYGEIGGIYNYNTLTINNSIISHNNAGWGGGIKNGSTFDDPAMLYINNCNIHSNHANDTGGGIVNWNGTLYVSESTISDNTSYRGAGIFNCSRNTSNPSYDGNQHILIIDNSLIDNNSASGSGGGIINDGSLTITKSTISNNQAGTALDNKTGGGIYFYSEGNVIIGGSDNSDTSNFNNFINNNAEGELPSYDQHIRNASGDCHTAYPNNYYTPDSNGTYSLRDIGPAGGWIFYDKGYYSDGWRYLEAAPASTEWTDKQWGSYEYMIGGTETGIGTGQSNTSTIVKLLNDISETNRAAQLCDALVYGGYSDWFLPSKDELNLMYQNLKCYGVGSFASSWYWSSSEDNAYDAWDQNFNDGGQHLTFKANGYGEVRAARAF